jgi:hypothetical protein
MSLPAISYLIRDATGIDGALKCFRLFWRPARMRHICQALATRNNGPKIRNQTGSGRKFDPRRAIHVDDRIGIAEHVLLLGEPRIENAGIALRFVNVWGWARLIPTVLGDGAWEKFPNLKRLIDEISARPAAQKAMALKDRHKFKTEMDAEAMQAMFPHLNVKVA